MYLMDMNIGKTLFKQEVLIKKIKIKLYTDMYEGLCTGVTLFYDKWLIYFDCSHSVTCIYQ